MMFCIISFAFIVLILSWISEIIAVLRPWVTCRCYRWNTLDCVHSSPEVKQCKKFVRRSDE